MIMCFTVNVNLVKEELERRYGADFNDYANHTPSYYYHAFSFPRLPVLYYDAGLKINTMQWGLVPSWISDSEAANSIREKTFNARSETIDEKPSFSDSFESRRCIVPVNGFYEWQHNGKDKIPWYIYFPDNEIVPLAGVWDRWMDESNNLVRNTFSIVTTQADSLMKKIHNHGERMPVVIDDSNLADWINPSVKGAEVKRLLNTPDKSRFMAHTISKMINGRIFDRNNPDIIKPFDYYTTGSLF